MQLKVYSDIHLEFSDWDFDVGEGDVLILAGDTVPAVDAHNCYNFFSRLGASYNRVFMVMGNHTHYHGRLDQSADMLRDYLPDNTTLLDNNSVYIDGVHFIGATLWADFHNDDKEMKELAGRCMNDYRTIMLNGDTQLAPMDTLAEHDNTVVWFNQVLPTLKMGKRVVITHHAPSPRSISPDYNSELSGAYASDLEDLILKHQPDYWFHGHIHSSNDYKIGETRVISNPRGYHPHGVNPSFDVNLTFDL